MMRTDPDPIEPNGSEECDAGDSLEAGDEELEIIEDLRIASERLRLIETEGTVSWESVKARHGL